MANDCLIIDNRSSKYYSMNPRYEVTIRYMDPDSIPAELYKILRLKGEEDHDEFN